MPKKSASARTTIQRTKQKTAPKNFELVRPDQEDVPLISEEEVSPLASTSTVNTAASSTPSSPVAVETPVSTPSAPASAATRLAARRQSQQRQQLRNNASLITTEHYSYVRKDLIYIAILAVAMLAIIIALYFITGVNA